MLEWNANGLAEAKLKQLGSIVDTRPELQMIGICEVKRDLNKEENIRNLSAIFPTEKWLKCYTKEGQGLITFVKYPKDQTCEIEIVDKSIKNGELMHAIKITNSENQSYNILSYYAPQSKPQQLKILSEKFKHEIENSDIAIGDLNKSLSTQPYRHSEYLGMLDQFERTELLELNQNTFIPHVSGQTAPTTQPDSVMTANTYTEELF